MKPIAANDLDFISRETKLTRDKTLALIEEDRDLNLILEQIANYLTKENLPNISFETYVKLVVFKFSKNKPYDISEKSYISNAIIDNYKKAEAHQKLPLIKTDTYSEKLIRYYIVLFGLFNKEPRKGMQMDHWLRAAGQREVAAHLKDWLEILSQIRDEKWFS